MSETSEPSAIELAMTTSESTPDLPSNSNTQRSSSPQIPVSTPILSLPRMGMIRFPVRIGITWKKGEKLEAMDFSRTWYPSKIVEIDEAAKQVLIHFEGWNHRYDEWVPMDSEKLRPVTRHSERKDKGVKKRRVHPHPIYRAGEKVLAKWTDCKKYPAKISRLMEDGMYEVIFYDGVTRHIQPMNIQPMPLDMSNLQKTVPTEACPEPKTKLSFKHIKVTLPESVKRLRENLCKKESIPSDNKPESPVLEKTMVISSSKATVDKVESSSEKDLGKGKMVNRKFPFQKSANFTSPEAQQANLEKSPNIQTPKPGKKRLTHWKIKSFRKLPVEFLQIESALSASSKEESKEVCGANAESAIAEVTTTSTSVSMPAITTPVKKVTVKEIADAESSSVEAIAAVAVVEQTATPNLSPSVLVPQTTKRTKRCNTLPGAKVRHRRVKSKSRDVIARAGGLTRRPPLLGQGHRAKSMDTGSSMGSPLLGPTMPAQVFVPSKAFIVEEDHNPFKCSHQGCSKAFRKETLLAYHIKYYHTDTEASASGVGSPLLHPATLQSPGGTPGIRKRRRKTSSICSTDSDVSISSRGKTSGIKPLHLSQDSTADDSATVDTEDEEMEADVVNCVCGQRETNGLMIQCEVCMCWQHFACVDANKSGVPPTNYVCNICENTPGIRDSCRHMCDMGWERRGELPSLPFVTDGSDDHLKSISCECNELTSALLAIKSALHSTRRQIKISKEEVDPEFQLWQTDWDNWTKPEEDLMLTPRSADPDPSPTPSTFLFPVSSHTDGLAAAQSSLSSSIITSVQSSDDLSSPQSTQAISSFNTASSITATIEVSSAQKLPSETPQTLPLLVEASSTNTSLPPVVTSVDSGTVPPQTLLAEDNSSSVPLKAQPGDIVKDLLFGADNDLQQSTSVLSLGKDNSSAIQTQRSTQGTENEQTHNGDSSNTKHDTCDKQLQQLENNQILGKSQVPQLKETPKLDASSQAAASEVNMQPGAGPTHLESLTCAAATNSSAVTQMPASGLIKMDMAASAEAETETESTKKQMTTLYVEVSGSQGLQAGEDDDTQDNDTDTAEESLDPYRNCEHNLLIHVSRVHSDIEKHLGFLEQQITELENSEHSNPTVQLSEDNILNDIPALKKSLNKFARNLMKVQHFCEQH